MVVRVAALPELHNAWLGTLTALRDVPAEPKATCSDCVMCGGPEQSGVHEPFSPNVKCCSYIPNLPNFLAGMAIDMSSVTRRLTLRDGVTPLGVGVSHRDVRALLAAQPGFGRSRAVMCPHFVDETGSCEIWRTRNAVCSTWFCKHGRGEVSQRFWHAVRDLLIAAEERIAYRCLTEGGLPDEQVEAVLDHRASIRATIAAVGNAAGDQQPETPEASDDPEDDPGWYPRMWGDWAGREREWFARCAELVSAMEPDDLLAWMDGVSHLIENVHQAFHALQRDPEVPDRLRFAPAAGSWLDGDLLRLAGYSPFDPVPVPGSLLQPLRELELTGLAGHVPHPISTDLLGQLLDFGVLNGGDSFVPRPRST